jgi:hypothetical protein
MTAVPFIGGLMNERPLVQTTNDIMEALSHARAQAILHSKPSVLEIRPQERTLRALAAGSGASGKKDEATQFISNDTAGSSSEVSGIYTAKIHEDVIVSMIEVNFMDKRDAPVAKVHFYPNGTCDMFAIVLEMDGQFRMIQRDMLTGIAEFETDPQKFQPR